MANGYLAFAAMLLAGLDGIINQIDPGPPTCQDAYDAETASTLKPMSKNLSQALEALQADRAFLTQDGVFSDDLIEAFIALKHKEVTILETTPHPAEFNMYYTL